MAEHHHGLQLLDRTAFLHTRAAMFTKVISDEDHAPRTVLFDPFHAEIFNKRETPYSHNILT
jgi:hypothetical protein